MRVRSILVWFFCLGALTAAYGDEVVGDAKIQQAAQALTSPRFRDREQASEELWLMGLKAKSELQRIAASSDIDARIRAQSILRDFQYGLLPDTPRPLRAKVLAFRDGDAAKKAQAFASLCADGSVQTLERLVLLEPDGAQRQAMHQAMFLHIPVAKHFSDLDKVDALLVRTGADQSNQWRTQTHARIVFSSGFLAVLSNQTKLQTLQGVVAKAPAKHRDFYLQAMIADMGSLPVVVQHVGSEFFFWMLDQTSSQPLKDHALLRLASNQTVMQTIVEADGFSMFAKRVRTYCSPGKLPTSLQAALRHSSVIAAIQNRNGWDGLVAAANLITEPKLNAMVMGRIMSDPAVIKNLATKGQWTKVTDFAKSQKSEEVRDAFLTALVKSKLFANLNDKDQVLAFLEIWEMAASSSNASLKRLAMNRVANPPNFAKLIEDDQRLLRLIKTFESLDENTLLLVSSTLLGQRKNIDLIRRTNRIGSFTRIISKMEGSRQVHLLDRLFRTPDENDSFDVVASFRLVLQQVDASGRVDFLVAMANTQAVRMSKQGELARVVFDAILESPSGQADKTLPLFNRSDPMMNLLAASSNHKWIDDRIKVASPDVACGIGRTLVQNRIFALFVNEALLDGLLQKSNQASPKVAEPLISAMFRSAAVTEALKKTNRMQWLLEATESISNVDAKATAAESLFGNYQATKELIQSGRFNDLLGLTKIHPSELRRSEVLGRFVSNRMLVQQMVQSQDCELLCSFTNPQWSLKQRSNFANQVVSRYAAVESIVKAGKFDALLDLVDELAARGEADTLAANMLANGPLVDRLVAKGRFFGLVDIAKFGSAMHRLQLQRLTAIQAAVSEFQRQKRLPELIGWLTTKSKQGGYVSSYWMHQSPHLMEALIATKQLDLVYDIIRLEPDPNQRHRLLESLLVGSQTVLLLVKAGELKTISELILRHAERSKEGTIWIRLLNSPVISHLLKEKRGDELWEVLDRRLNQKTRQTVVTRIMTHAPMIKQLAEAGYQERLFGWIDKTEDPTTKARCISALIASGYLDAMLERSGPASVDAILDSSVLTPALIATLGRSGSTIKALQQQRMLPSIIAACEKSKDRLSLIAAILTNRKFRETLDRSTQIDPWVNELVTTTDEKVKQLFMTRVIYEDALYEIVFGNGHFLAIIDWIGKSRFSAPQQRYRTVSRLISRASKSAEFARHVDLSVIEELIDSVDETYHGNLRKQAFLNQLSAAEWIKAGKSELWLSAVEDCSPSDCRGFLTIVAIYGSELFRDPNFAKAFEQLALQQPEGYRKSPFIQVVTTPKLRWAMLASGQKERLIHWGKLSGGQLRTMSDLLFSSSGEVAFAIHGNQMVKARDLLVEQAAVDAGSVHLASFYQQLGDLDSQIEKLQQASDLEPHQQLCLIDFLRASGRPEEAARFAIKYRRLNLVTDLFAEARNWKAAATWQGKFIDLDRADRHRGRDWKLSTISELSLLAMFQWFADDQDSVTTTINEMRTRCNEFDDKRSSECLALTLIRCGKSVEGFKELFRVNPLLAIRLRIARHQYGEAIKELGFDTEGIEKWLEEFPTPNQKSASKWSRIELGTLVAELHVGAGQLEVAAQIYRILNVRANAASSSQARRKYRMHVVRSLRRTGQSEEFYRAIIELGREPSQLRSNRLEAYRFGKRDEREMRAWWSFISSQVSKQRRDAGQQYPTPKRWTEEEAIAGLRLFDDIQDSDNTIRFDGKSWPIVQFVEQVADSKLVSSPAACCIPLLLRHGLHDEAAQYLKRHPIKYQRGPPDWLMEMYLRAGNFESASKGFLKNWSTESRSSLSLLLSELALLADNERNESGAMPLNSVQIDFHQDIAARNASMMAVRYQDRSSRAIDLASSPFETVSKSELNFSRRLTWPSRKVWCQMTRQMYELEQDETTRLQLRKDLAWASIAIGANEYPWITSCRRYADVVIGSDESVSPIDHAAGR